MLFAKLVDNELIYAEDKYIRQDGVLILNFNNNEDLMREYGYKLVVDNPPIYNEETEELHKVGISEDEKTLNILYEKRSIDLEPIKLQKIMKTKEDLTTYLFNNPIFSTCHYSDGAYYAVTSEKQAQLTQLLTSYMLDTQLGINTELHWNSTGNMCEIYTFEELTQLRHEIFAFVLPLVSLQQYIEVSIKNSNSLAEIQAVDMTISYERAIEIAKQNS